MTRPGDADTAVRRPEALSPSAPAAYVIEVVDGEDQGKRALIDATLEAPLLVGTGAACGLVLADREVSRRHASFELEGESLRLLDLGSTNGTKVGTVRVREALLSGGEQVVVGATVLGITPLDQGRKLELPSTTQFGRVLGQSLAMRRLFPLFERVAASMVPVVIEGETGTGKELVAEALHERGPRADGPFEVFDCTTVAEELIEAALFGHERGAFTGATQQRKGVFEQAHGGTLLLDEIGDLDLALQAKLLRAIERSEVRRVGGDRWIRVDVRVMAATRRDLDREVQEGRFRDDLFYRLAVARIALPPLRKREGDVEWLAARFWREAVGEARPLPAALKTQLHGYAWPGNVRELANAVARFAALGDLATGASETPTSTEDLETEAATVIDLALPLTEARRRVVERFERRYLEAMLARHGGSVRAAAEAAGIARRWFQLIRARQRE